MERRDLSYGLYCALVTVLAMTIVLFWMGPAYAFVIGMILILQVNQIVEG